MPARSIAARRKRPFSSSAPLPKMPVRSAERAGPAELVQHHAADEGAHRRAAGDRLQRSLLVGAEDARGAVDAIDDHAADPDEIERRSARSHAGSDARTRASSGRLALDRERRGAMRLAGETARTLVEASSKRSASGRVSAGVPGATSVARDHAERGAARA